MKRDTLVRWIRAGLLLAIVDGLFSSVLSVAFYNSTVARLFQRVASMLLGPSALQGGTRAELIGMAMHVGVAFGWSAVFLFGVMRLATVQRVLSTRFGVLKVATVYGPCVWLVMSLLVVPTLSQVPPSITIRWWVQLIGHIPFVGLPIVAAIASRPRAQARIDVVSATA